MYLFFHFFLLVSLRNVGELAGVLSRTYIPSLDEGNEKQRSTYGNGRFKFPNNYKNDNFNGYGGYNNQEEEEEGEEEDEEDEDEDDTDNHYIVSLIACEIFQQKQREKELAREEERNFSLLEEERCRVERLNELHAIAIFEMKEEREKEIIRIKDLEREREEEMLRAKEENEKREREDREKEQIHANAGLNNSMHFWDDLLLKPLPSIEKEMEVERKNEKKVDIGKERKDRENDKRDVNKSQENESPRFSVNSRSSFQSPTDPMDILRNIPGEIEPSFSCFNIFIFIRFSNPLQYFFHLNSYIFFFLFVDNFIILICIKTFYFLGRPPLHRRSTQDLSDVENYDDSEDTNNSNDSNNKNFIKFSPSEMRLRMINELKKQEEIFTCVLELSQIEQSHAIQSASQLMQHYMIKHEMEQKEKNLQNELFLQKTAYESSLSRAVTNNEIYLIREKMSNEEALAFAQNEIKQQELQSKLNFFLFM